eukprot:9483070-Pyramimonas_sp.AAC.1
MDNHGNSKGRVPIGGRTADTLMKKEPSESVFFPFRPSACFESRTKKRTVPLAPAALVRLAAPSL